MQPLCKRVLNGRKINFGIFPLVVIDFAAAYAQKSSARSVQEGGRDARASGVRGDGVATR